MNLTPSTQAVLFADICGSTGLYPKMGDARAKHLIDGVLDRMSQVVQRHGGQVLKRLGDAVMAVFDEAGASFRAAEQIHSRIQGDSSLEPGAGALTLHSGVHWGQVITTADDVHGDAVNLAARLADAAGPGQILTSEQMVMALEPAQRRSTRFVTRMTPRGSAEELKVYELLWDAAGLTIVAPVKAEITDSGSPGIILILGGGQVEVSRSHPLATLGRGVHSDLVLDRAWVSRSHARVELRRSRLVLIDFSSNGTFVYPDSGSEFYLKQDKRTLEGKGIICLGRERENVGDDRIEYRTWQGIH